MRNFSNFEYTLEILYKQEAELEDKLSKVREAIRECINHMNLNKYGEESSIQYKKMKKW